MAAEVLRAESQGMGWHRCPGGVVGAPWEWRGRGEGGAAALDLDRSRVLGGRGARSTVGGAELCPSLPQPPVLVASLETLSRLFFPPTSVATLSRL